MSSQSNQTPADGAQIGGRERDTQDAETRRRVRVAALEAEVDLHERREAGVGDDVAALTDRVEALEGDVNDLEAEVVDLESDVDDLERELSSEIERVSARCERIVHRHARTQSNRDAGTGPPDGPVGRLRTLFSRE